MGIMSYLSSPLWLLLLIVSAIDMLNTPSHAAASYTSTYIGGIQPALALAVSHTVDLVPLVLATAAILYGPKFLALAALLATARALRGPWRLLSRC